MPYEMIATGNAFELTKLSGYEEQFAEQDRGVLELDLRLPVSQNVASQLEDKLRQAGVQGLSVVTASPMIRVYFTKGFPWLAVIVAAVLGLIAIVILIVGWRLFREVAAVIPPVPLAIGLIAALVLGIMVLARGKR